jgi:hypothetical protein
MSAFRGESSTLISKKLLTAYKALLALSHIPPLSHHYVQNTKYENLRKRAIPCQYVYREKSNILMVVETVVGFTKFE